MKNGIKKTIKTLALTGIIFVLILGGRSARTAREIEKTAAAEIAAN